MGDCRVFSVKNWAKYQHYKDRNPPWVKLHKDLWWDSDFVLLPLKSKFLYIGLLTVASVTDNRIPDSRGRIAAILGLEPRDVDLQPLIAAGFLSEIASNALEIDYRRYVSVSSSLSSVQEQEEEQRMFVEFWKLYPRHEGKQAAVRSWHKLKPAERRAAMLDVPQRKRANWEGKELQHIPHAATYLNQQRWQDELVSPGAVNGGGSPYRYNPKPRELVAPISEEQRRENMRFLRELTAGIGK